jgi:hypothetical protein
MRAVWIILFTNAMTFALSSVHKCIGSLAIIAVTLWLGGFGCSLCCATGATDSCCLDARKTQVKATASAESMASCDMASADCSCCKTSRADSKIASRDNAIQREGAIGCSLLPNRLEGVTVQVRATDALLMQGGLTALPVFFHSPTRTASLLEAPQPLNRGGTYLRCGVLLI